jgi:hypothetical protein
MKRVSIKLVLQAAALAEDDAGEVMFIAFAWVTQKMPEEDILEVLRAIRKKLSQKKTIQ